MGAQLRSQFKSSMSDYYAELENLGEKLAILGRYGKQLAATMPDTGPEFPATPRTTSSVPWDGAERAKELRLSVRPALARHTSSNVTEPLIQNDSESDANNCEVQLNMEVPELPPSRIASAEVSDESGEESKLPVPETGTAPIDPTVAETGIVPDGSSGPRSGQLRRVPHA